MRSKIIEEQLNTVIYADLKNYCADTNSFIIPKYLKPRYLAGKCYLISLSNEIINNPNTILATNWNNGRSPKNKYYKAVINKLVGKMILVDALAYDFENKCDLTEMFSGYLDTEQLIQICEVK